MRVARIAVALAFAVAFTKAQCQPTPVALVHGFSSSGSTWQPFMMFMSSNANYIIPTPVELDASAPIWTQAATLQSYLGTNNLGSNAILLGHSQGGLVSRAASRTDSVFGILTIGTPHLGASIAAGTAPTLLYLSETGADDGVAEGGISDIDCYNYSFFLCTDAQRARQDLANGWGSIAIALGFAIDIVYSGNAALADMTPGSQFITELNQHYGVEHTGKRTSIQAQIDGGYDGGPLRLVWSAVDAESAGTDLVIWGYTIEDDAFQLLNDDPSDDPYYNDHQIAGAAMFDLAGQLGNFAYFWHYDIVGGTPNDVVGPVGTQHMPGAIDFPITGPSHFEETAFTGNILLGQLNAMTGR